VGRPPHLVDVGVVEGLEKARCLVQERVDEVGDEIVPTDLAKRLQCAGSSSLMPVPPERPALTRNVNRSNADG
jgi:hypothetical protein